MTIACGCCGGKAHNIEDMIAYKVYLPDPNTPKAELLKIVCDICGETRSKYRSPIAATIAYHNASTGELIRQDHRCTECFDEFMARHSRQQTIDEYCQC